MSEAEERGDGGGVETLEEELRMRGTGEEFRRDVFEADRVKGKCVF